MTIIKPYRLILISPEGEIVLDITLEGIDFHKPLASSEFTDFIEKTIVKTEKEYAGLEEEY